MHLDDAHASQLRCLLKTLETTTFDAHDAAADQRYVDLNVSLLVAAYDSSAYDFFVAQLGTTSTRVQHGLVPALVNAGVHLPEFARWHPVPGPLNGVCDAAWNEVDYAIWSLRQLHGIETRQVQEKVNCLLTAISTARFDPRDERFNDYLVGDTIHILIAAYGPEGYDFFASQIPRQPDRISSALMGTLMQHGDPEAFAAYFASHNERRDVMASPGSLGALLERGECAEPICSSRLNETLHVLSENLDIIESDLRKVSVSPSAQQRQRASDLLELVHCIRRGETTLGRSR